MLQMAADLVGFPPGIAVADAPGRMAHEGSTRQTLGDMHMANEKETPTSPTPTPTTTTGKGGTPTTNAGPGSKTGDVPIYPN